MDFVLFVSSFLLIFMKGGNTSYVCNRLRYNKKHVGACRYKKIIGQEAEFCCYHTEVDYFPLTARPTVFYSSHTTTPHGV